MHLQEQNYLLGVIHHRLLCGVLCTFDLSGRHYHFKSPLAPPCGLSLFLVCVCLSEQINI